MVHANLGSLHITDIDLRLGVRLADDSGQNDIPGTHYLSHWETLDTNCN